MKYLNLFLMILSFVAFISSSLSAKSLDNTLNEAVLNGANLSIETDGELSIFFANTFHRDSKRLTGKELDVRILKTCEQWRNAAILKHKDTIAKIEPCREAGSRAEEGLPRDAVSHAGADLTFKNDQTLFTLRRRLNPWIRGKISKIVKIGWLHRKLFIRSGVCLLTVKRNIPL